MDVLPESLHCCRRGLQGAQRRRHSDDRRSETTVYRSRIAAQRALISALGSRVPAGVPLSKSFFHARLELRVVGCDRVQTSSDSLHQPWSRCSPRRAGGRSCGCSPPAVATQPSRFQPFAHISPTERAFRLRRWRSLAWGDMSQAVRRSPSFDGPTSTSHLTTSFDGPGARSVLPRLAALSKQMDATCTKPVEPSRLVRTVAAVATRPEDAGIALQTLSPILRCSSTLTSTAEAVGRLGADGRNVLLKYLRDEDNTIRNRLNVLYVLQQGGAKFDSEDQELVHLLQAKAARFNRPEAQVQMPEPERDPITTAGEEFTACRAEAGLAGCCIDQREQANKIRWCLQSHL